MWDRLSLGGIGGSDMPVEINSQTIVELLEYVKRWVKNVLFRWTRVLIIRQPKIQTEKGWRQFVGDEIISLKLGAD
jgi:hypothetical protein